MLDIIKYLFRAKNYSAKNFGRDGEDIAERYLKKNRYKIVERNFRVFTGEIDIVAKENGEVVFVEVKTRMSGEAEFLGASVSGQKRKRMVSAARYYIKKHKLEDKICRFDVVLISFENDKPVVDLIKDAFLEDDIYEQ